METDLKCCYNLKCQRYHIGCIGKFCSGCGQEMRNFRDWFDRSDYGPRVGDIERPPSNYSRKERKAMRKGRRMEGGIWLPGWSDVGEYMDYTPTKTEAITVAVKPKAKDWTCDAGQVNGCPIAKAMDVHVPITMYDEWVMLADSFSTEWLAYLMGHQTENGTWVIDSYYFPKQIANGGHCNVVEGVEGKDECLPDTIGSVHSHVRMGAFFSGEDTAHFNHPVELVVNAKGEIKANVAIKLQCGHPSRAEAKVFTLGTRVEQPEHPKVTELKSKLTPQASHESTSENSSKYSQNWVTGEGGTQYVRET